MNSGPLPIEAAEHIRTHVNAMVLLARAADLGFLAYLLGMAHLEADRQSRGVIDVADVRSPDARAEPVREVWL